LVGKKAAKSFVVLFIHAPLELKEKHYLTFRECAMNGGIPKKNIANVTDMILEERLGMTLYGTRVQEKQDGTMEPVPILHEENVEARHQELGIKMPLKTYYSMYGINYGE